MMCFVHYVSSVLRLRESEKTVAMMREEKNSDRGVPRMVLAQRDFIQNEMEYFKDECIKFTVISLALCISIVLTLALFYWG